MAKKITKNTILVVIPYLAEAAQGRELEFAVAGWRRHFKEDHHIVIVGDRHEVVDTGEDITFIECPRVPAVEGQYRPHLDHVHKFRKVREAFPASKGFIYACDDMYAVGDFDMTTVLFPKICRKEMEEAPLLKSGWLANQTKTKALCRREHLPLRDWVCHLPVYYEWDKLLAIYDQYDCDHESYVVENIYFNRYHAGSVPLVLDIRYDNLKCGIYRSNPNWDVVKAAFGTKVWITNGVMGYLPPLERALDAHYFSRK